MKTLIIKKGNHYSTFYTFLKFFPWIAINKNELKITIEITPEMISVSTEKDCIKDSNKIFGLNKDLFSHHHKDSFRISYITHPKGTLNGIDYDCVQFVEYDYINSVRISNELTGYYKVGDIAVINHKLPYTIKIGRKLFPYHGGTCVAKHDIILKCKIEYL